MNLQNEKVLVVGIARSGIAVAKFLREKGAKVTLTDIKERQQLGTVVDELEAAGITLVLGQQPEINKSEISFIVISPGVPLRIEPIQKAYQQAIPIYSEVEIASRYAKAPIVAITGTNGKTTTTSLIGEMFENAGYKTFVAGNIGVPVIERVEAFCKEDMIVAEVSSFQLETTKEFKPKVSLILNITPDHLDRHGNLENYAEAKAKIFANQDSTDFTVLNFDDQRVSAFAKETKGKVIFFSRKHILEEGVYVEDGQIIAKINTVREVICPINDVKIPGNHNLENALAAVATGMSQGLETLVIADTLRNFGGVSHRLEFVAEINGVRFVNDSKGTNPDASIKALEAYSDPIVLIAGGKNKGSDFGEFADKIKAKVKELVLIGQAAPQIKEAVENIGFTNIHEVKDYPEAVKMANQVAHPGDIVLLSPACASWDMFNSYEERGNLFKQVVNDLRG